MEITFYRTTRADEVQIGDVLHAKHITVDQVHTEATDHGPIVLLRGYAPGGKRRHGVRLKPDEPVRHALDPEDAERMLAAVRQAVTDYSPDHGCHRIDTWHEVSGEPCGDLQPDDENLPLAGTPE